MSQRLTLGSLRTDKRFTQCLNICQDDERLGAWVSNFQERAWTMGRWWGTYQLATFCLDGNSCIVLPREVALIESANLDGVPMRMGNMWYDFIKPHEPCDSPCFNNGSCSCGCGCGPMTMIDKGTAASFATTTGVNKKIRVYPGNAADVGKTILFQGYDSNGVWVRTTIDGARSDGEEVTLAMPYVDTTTVWGPGAPVAVVKEATAYRVLVYSVTNDVDATELQLAEYAPAETHPMYRVVSIPGISTTGCECEERTLKAVVSLQHIPLISDSDWLLFTNLTAYKQGVMAEKYYEEGNIVQGDAYFYGLTRPSRNARGVLRHTSGMGAIPLLQAELRRMTGDMTSIQVGGGGLNLAGFM